MTSRADEAVTPTQPGARKGWRSRDGISMAEVLVALFIFAVAVTGLCSLSVIAREASDRARDHYVAINLAKNRLERAKSFEFGQLYLFEEYQTPVDITGKSDPNGDYRRSTIVTNVNAGLTEVRVTVEIRNRDTWEFVPGVEDIRSYVADVWAPAIL